MSSSQRFASIVVLVVAGGCGRTALDGPDGGQAPLGGAGAAGAGGTGGSPSTGGASGGGGGPSDLVVIPQLAVLPAGQTLEMSAYARSNGADQDVTALAGWQVNDSGVATFGGLGGPRALLRGVAPGQTTVSASYLGGSAMASVQVVADKITALQVTPPQSTLAPGKTQQFQATALYTSGRRTDVSAQGYWQAQDPRVAQMSNLPGSRGQATGLAPGKTVITASFAGAQGSGALTVQGMVSLTSLAITPANPTVAVGGAPTELILTGMFSDGTTRNLTTTANWSSSNGMIARVAGGRVQCNGAGSVIVSAAAMGQSTSTTVTCASVPIVMVRLTPGSTPIAPVAPGTALQFYLTAFFADGTQRDVTTQAMWSSDNPAVVTVQGGGNQRGLARAVGAGMATIIATFGGMTAKTVLIVTM